MRPLPRLKEIRERAFLTQLELARKSGIAVTTISRIEMEHHEARFATIKRLAEALGVQPQDLVGDANDHPPAPVAGPDADLDEGDDVPF